MEEKIQIQWKPEASQKIPNETKGDERTKVEWGSKEECFGGFWGCKLVWSSWKGNRRVEVTGVKEGRHRQREEESTNANYEEGSRGFI